MTHIKKGEKLFIITRRDLSLGYQAVQSCHAMRLWNEEHKEKDDQWYKSSNYLALLAVENEKDLLSLLEKAEERNILCSYFREPDLDDEITAIVLEPGVDSRRLTSYIKLMGS